jgi:hypothetical protein
MNCPNCGAVVALAPEALVLIAPPPPPAVPVPSPPVALPFGVRVQGTRLIDKDGVPLQLRGVNRMGGEYMCIQNQARAFDGPIDQPSIDAMKAWRMNVVRLPLNEHCWLGIGGNPQAEPYRAAVQDYVDRLVANGLYVILDLHWSAPSGQVAAGLQAMPNTSYSRDFWFSVATRFKNNPAVLFNVFNEPIPNNNENDATDDAARRSWECWRDGGLSCSTPLTRGYQPIANTQTVGMQALVDAVRATGATNVIVLGGIQWANTVWSSPTRNVLTYLPLDPLRQMVASLHVYEDTWTRVPADWDREVTPVAAQMPVIFGEFGHRPGDAVWLNNLMSWADAHASGYLAWTWFSSGELRLANLDGTATPYGAVIRDHIIKAVVP